MIILYDLGYRFLFWIKRLRRRFPAFTKAAQTYEYYFSLFVNRKLAPWLEAHPAQKGLNTKKRKESYIVSLTSFPVRIGHVHLTIETLLRQRFKPDGIVLYLAESQFPGRKLPETLENLQTRGLTVRWCDDLRSHKKYFYAFRDYPDANIILADDDIFYSRDTVKKLARLHKKHPKDIICQTAQIIGPEISSLPSVWPPQQVGKQYISSMRAQAFTGAGSLFPPRWYPEELFNKEKAMSLAGTADDLWLKAMSLIAGVRTTLVYPQRGFPLDIHIPNNQTLFSINGAQGTSLNDSVWQALVEEYGLDKMR